MPAVLGSRHSRVRYRQPEGILLTDPLVLRREHQERVQPCGERWPTSSRHTVTFEAQSHGGKRGTCLSQKDLLGDFTSSANRETDQGTKSDLPKTTQEVSGRIRMSPAGLPFTVQGVPPCHTFQTQS